MLIQCPYCGPRDLAEFAVNGEAVARPGADGGLDSAASRAAFAAAVYLRDNPAGLHREHWFHAAGCQSWLLIERDTRTHDILKVEATRAPEQAS
ncbi:Sarcosine oxidase subunit delta [Methylocella tundrae]|uniref:Sarcosine oxidase subunit delta n=1 Tax=Methylocella tundrae TaxID=227605 RepID=A0A8B6M9H3_METTU|nr:sarcosine oxidase subunit delta [Methylocella tundrae]VTZ26853.1 Sarcosine oxidase subunit delta [Methylocella tundrae]VTZ51647.1 Sarcosine oxidase subunit delta [Methylocella tundrae]